jgi:deoxyribonuclease V
VATQPAERADPGWDDDERLRAEQVRLGAQRPEPWVPGAGPLVAAGCFVAFARGEQGPGHAGDHAWVGAALVDDLGRELVGVAVPGRAGASYAPGLLAHREGEMLLAALEDLPERPDVLFVDATGRDHPRRAGLALHLGALLDVPSIGVTHRPLVARGDPPPADAERGRWSALTIDGEEVARWVVTQPGVRPLVAHPAWRTDAATAADLVVRFATTARTPEPLRIARGHARVARASAP